MKAVLTDGTELQLLMVTGAQRHIRYLQGASRDCLTFVFSEDVSMDEIDSLFTEANCESIIIVGSDGSEAIYKGYTIRAELKKADVEAEQETLESEAVTVKRVTVSMAQRTYLETKMAALADESTTTQLAVAELAELVVGGAE